MILKFLRSQRNSMPFLNPVDHVRLGIPDYPLHIKHPMDLGTIWLNLRDKPWDPKVRARKYQNPSEFLADVRLVFENCRIFNPAGQPVRSMGDQLSELFEKVWLKCDLEAKWRNLEAASMPQGDEEQEDASGQSVEVLQQLLEAQMERQLAKKRSVLEANMKRQLAAKRAELEAEIESQLDETRAELKEFAQGVLGNRASGSGCQSDMGARAAKRMKLEKSG